MPPGSAIGLHSDNMNFVLTAHVGLRLDPSGCSLSVGEHTSGWREGEALVFDTSYLHAAENASGRDRDVLVVRFWHPGVTEEERYALLFLLAVMDRLKRREDAQALFQARHETRGPRAAPPPQQKGRTLDGKREEGPGHRSASSPPSRQG